MLRRYNPVRSYHNEIRSELESSDLTLRLQRCGGYETPAQDIADGLVVGWFQGRMEFGPRALGPIAQS